MTQSCNINDDDDQFCKNKLLLEPRDATLFDLICLIFSSDVKNRRFVDCPEEHRKRDFARRWLIFVSVLSQKIILHCRKPMARVGYALEMWLNLLSSNGGIFKLLFNFLTWNVRRPERSSVTFTSALGNLDLRVDLDKNIKPGHKKYYFSLSLMAAKLAYENEAFIQSVVTNNWNMEFLGFYNFWNDYQERSSTQAFMLQDSKTDPNLIVLAFRGTAPFDAYAWCTDVDLSWYELQGVGKVHRGFMKALGLQNQGWPVEIHDRQQQNQNDDRHLYAYYELREMLKDMLRKKERAKFIVTGHSLGGALAILFVGVLGLHEKKYGWMLERLEGVYTFGQPRVGDSEFREFMKGVMRKYAVRYVRFVYENDMVPRLPYDDKRLLFKHFGTCLFFNSCYKGKVVWEEPNKNYFSLLWVLPKMLNAIWELIRSSVIMPIKKGSDYRESWLMKTLRIIGVVIPGLSAHACQDYDNATRLGSYPSSLHLQDYSHPRLHHD